MNNTTITTNTKSTTIESSRFQQLFRERFTCSKCREGFYHREELVEHNCTVFSSKKTSSFRRRAVSFSGHENIPSDNKKNTTLKKRSPSTGKKSLKKPDQKNSKSTSTENVLAKEKSTTKKKSNVLASATSNNTIVPEKKELSSSTRNNRKPATDDGATGLKRTTTIVRRSRNALASLDNLPNVANMIPNNKHAHAITAALLDPEQATSHNNNDCSSSQIENRRRRCNSF